MTRNSSRMGVKLIRITSLYDITVNQVYAYVRSLHRHIRKQNSKIRKLRQKMGELKKVQNLKAEVLRVEEDEDDVLRALEKAEKQQEQSSIAVEPLDVKAFVDDIKKTAEDFDYQNRYVYEPTSGMYYDPATGYYYNAIYGLHYDGQRGCYLKYNEEKQEYEFYSQVMPEQALGDKKPDSCQKKRKEASASVTIDEESKAVDRPRRRRSDSIEEKPRLRERSAPRPYWRSRSRSRSHSRTRRYRKSRTRSRSRERERDRDRDRRRDTRRQRHRSKSHESSGSPSSSDEDIASFFRFVRKDKAGRKRKGKNAKRSGQSVESDDNREEGELDSSSGSSDSERRRKSVVLVRSSSSEGDVPVKEFAGNYSDVVRKYPPSLRLIVQKTNIEELKQGSLFIVTCMGGTLGREGNHDVIIPDLNVSKYHLNFTYNADRGVYQVVDLGSRNGTILNGVRMTGSMQESDPFDIDHGDTIQLNQTRLLCHVHDGNVTCDNCEPGLLVKGSAGGVFDGDRITKPVSHKEGLKLLQKRYGLEDEKYVEPAEPIGPDYKDRAAHRRKTKGSSNEHAKTQAASVDQHIGSENKGFKMLSKLGWSAGKTLGKNDEGLVEPIPLLTNVGTSGLGSQELAQPTSDRSVDERKRMIWKLAQERFKKCADVVEKSTSDSKSSPAASLHQHISSENKGFQMLSKLGWNKGDTLGNNEDGLKEPIKLLSNVGTSGLGNKPLKQLGSTTKVSGNKSIMWKKKQKQVQSSKMFYVSDSD
ncbi:angiogenic factor with G patch and FHA domains 1 [Topomyia yanbarensis]|uniref:angiogenic factor with G patch and FHA domains 1 n=1 Tax=Topomyia yanbarensis TaxID=2498891 RepID=UPI00273CF38D|nr:angiogenic factor with G patch and FHA domains 1 [Topomyia yanbarensis]